VQYRYRADLHGRAFRPDKQDCESRAARRWLTAHGSQYARLKPVYLGDDLFANQPMCEAVLAVGGHFLFTCKPASHPLIGEYITGVELPTHTVRIKRGREWVTHRFRWLTAVPLRDGRDALTANWFEIEICNAAGQVTYRTAALSPICRLSATRSPSWPPAAAPGGRSRTRRSTC
jgi:hypothetical protein